MKTFIQAVEFAERAHRGQTRKYSGEPYIIHPFEVSRILAEAGYPPSVMTAGVLHDVVEDTPHTIDEISILFGGRVAALVAMVTDVSVPTDGNRAFRKKLDLIHLSASDHDGATIKLADLISNTQSITKCDPTFAKTYMAEKKELLKVLWHGNRFLWARATSMVRNYEEGKL